jgi:hypothetical protein
MPRAIQHNAILNVTDLGIVLMPGVPQEVTPAQAETLRALGVTVLPDPQPASSPVAAPSPSPIPNGPDSSEVIQ